MNLERLEAINRIATKRYKLAKKKGNAMDCLNYLSAKLTSTALLEAIKNWELKPSKEEYEYWIEDYNWMFEK